MGELGKKLGLGADATFQWSLGGGGRLRAELWHTRGGRRVRWVVGFLRHVRVGGVVRWHAYTVSQGHVGLFDTVDAARGAVACWVGADLRQGWLAFGGRV